MEAGLGHLCKSQTPIHLTKTKILRMGITKSFRVIALVGNETCPAFRRWLIKEQLAFKIISGVCYSIH